MSPFTATGLALPLPETGVAAPMSADEHAAVNDVTTYPLSLPGVKATDSEPLPFRDATAAVGALGTAPGVTALEGADVGLEPTSLWAITVQVYDAPLVRELTVTGEPAWFNVLPGVPVPDEQLTSYWAGRPPSAPGVNATWISPSPRTAMTLVGASGARAGMNVFESADCGPVPRAFVARTKQVYVWPLSRPVTKMEVVVSVAVPVAAPLEVHVTV